MSAFSLKSNLVAAAFSAAAVVLIMSLAFVTLEPAVTRAITDQFLINQTVTTGISFEQNANDVTMVGTLNGLTGGTSYGTTTVRVRTNNVLGYNMTIQFSSTTAMTRTGGSGWINNYLYSTGTAAYPSGYNTGVSNAQFGFSVNASNTSDISSVFTHSGSACGTGNNGSFTVNNCWRGASTTNETYETELINRSSPTPASGSTSTIQFRITIPNNPSPSVPDGNYQATATLTALDNT